MTVVVSEAGEIPALSRNGHAPSGDESGRLMFTVHEPIPRGKERLVQWVLPLLSPELEQKGDHHEPL